MDFTALSSGAHRLACPHCAVVKTRAKDKALSVDVTHEGGAYLCHRCGWRGGWRSGPTARPAQQANAKVHLSLASHWRSFWDSLQAITPGTTAYKYLTARACAIPPTDGDLRCTEELRHSGGYLGPALVGLVTHAETREPMTLHRTWIMANGNKADVEPPRLLLRQHVKKGGVIRLWPDEAVTRGLTIAEGIETALTVAEEYAPVWSCIDAGNLGALPVLGGIESLLIAADNDPDGLRATQKCADRWYRAGREVQILRSPIPGQDLNDFARAA